MGGEEGDDLLTDDTGGDFLFGGTGNDQLVSGSGNDQLKGGAGNDLLNGDLGNDVLYGGSGKDTLRGDFGNDTLKGGQDDDTLVGGLGFDSLSGGGGSDFFVFDSPKEKTDVITDFVSADDTIAISASGFDIGLTPGIFLSPEQLVIGQHNQDSNDIFIFKPGSGALFFDPDGNGSATRIRIAIFLQQPLLSADDIFIGDILSS
jgi:Ca2+-binding RTX toxin-like protein